MSTRKEREKFDALTSRIFLFLFGCAVTAIGCFFFSVDHSIDSALSIAGYASTAIGLAIVLSSLLLDDATTIKYAESTGNSEIMVLFVLLAFFFAWCIDRVKKST